MEASEIGDEVKFIDGVFAVVVEAVVEEIDAVVFVRLGAEVLFDLLAVPIDLPGEGGLVHRGGDDDHLAAKIPRLQAPAAAAGDGRPRLILAHGVNGRALRRFELLPADVFVPFGRLMAVIRLRGEVVGVIEGNLVARFCEGKLGERVLEPEAGSQHELVADEAVCGEREPLRAAVFEADVCAIGVDVARGRAFEDEIGLPFHQKVVLFALPGVVGARHGAAVDLFFGAGEVHLFESAGALDAVAVNGTKRVCPEIAGKLPEVLEVLKIAPQSACRNDGQRAVVELFVVEPAL